MSFDGISQNLWDANALDGLGNSDTLGGDITTAISVNNIFIEQNYLRLDNSNGPMTGTLTINGGVSISGLTITNSLSAQTYYGVPSFTGNLDGNLSVSGNTFLRGNMSVSGYTYLDETVMNGVLYMNDTIQSSSNINCDVIQANTGNIGVANIGDNGYGVGLLVLNQVSVNNTIHCANNVSVANQVRCGSLSVSNLGVINSLSVGTYYNLPDINNLNGNLSVSGSIWGNSISVATYHNLPSFNGLVNGNLSVSGSSFVKGNEIVSGQISVYTNIICNKISVFSTSQLGGTVGIGTTIATRANLAMVNGSITNYSLADAQIPSPTLLTEDLYLMNNARAIICQSSPLSGWMYFRAGANDYAPYIEFYKNRDTSVLSNSPRFGSFGGNRSFSQNTHGELECNLWSGWKTNKEFLIGGLISVNQNAYLKSTTYAYNFQADNIFQSLAPTNIFYQPVDFYDNITLSTPARVIVTGSTNSVKFYDEGPNNATTDTYTDTTINMTAGDFDVMWCFTYKSANTTTSGAGHKLQYRYSGTWYDIIADNTNIETANKEFHASRCRAITISTSWDGIRVQVGTLASGTQTLVSTDCIINRRIYS